MRHIGLTCILEHNFEQFSCIQKQKIYDEIFGWLGDFTFIAVNFNCFLVHSRVKREVLYKDDMMRQSYMYGNKVVPVMM